MLGMKTYPKDYVDRCRARVDADVAAYKKGKAARTADAAFFNNMVLVLDYLFVHRLRTVEGKDGNPLNEVRIYANSMLHNNNVLTFRRPPTEPGNAESGIKLSTDSAVLPLKEGDEIKLTAPEFKLLADAFFAEIENRYA
jgi:hypothetical protein